MKSTLTAACPTPDTSFRLFPQPELAWYCARNAQYSLRAFALHLGVDHPTLSQWLRARGATIFDSAAATITRGYDLLDRLTSETTPEGSISYTHDGQIGAPQ